jgi:hypothetical protein
MKRPRNATRIIALAIVLMASCTNRPLIKVEPETESYVMQVLHQAETLGVDVLVVVDNSRSMLEEQALLAGQFPELIRSLLNPAVDPDTGKLVHVPVKDLHIGVISTDMGTGGFNVETCADPVDGDDGILLHEPSPIMTGCDAAYPNYLSYESEEPDVALVEKMATDFGCIAVLGSDGCGFEQQLEASLKALTTHASGANAGFLRPDSILLVLFVTDEEDCSVEPGHEEIFDTTRSDLGHLNLRCFHHPYMVRPIDRYIEGFRALRSDPQKFVLGVIAGVPPVEMCQGFGNDLGGCLDLPDMIEKVDPVSMTKLLPSCRLGEGEAFPARRFVQLAQNFDENAYVHSICTDDFGPAISALTKRLHGIFEGLISARELETEKDEADECRCLASCSIIEELTDARACPAGRPCFEPDGPGTGCGYAEDLDGFRRTLCVIPQAGTRISDCSLSCTDPAAMHTVDGEGWYYMQYGDGGFPQVLFTDTAIPEEGSIVYIQCESMICPENRQCGPEGFEGSMCCDEDAYCDRAAAGGPTCISRPD